MTKTGSEMQIVDTNAVDLFNAAGQYEGNISLVELTGTTIRFLAEDRSLIADYTIETFASVTGMLALDLGRGIYLVPAAVAELQSWARYAA